MRPFEEAYEAYQDLVFRFLYRMCQDETLAEELCQETFYQALKGWNRYRGEGKISTWLCAIAKRVYYKSLRGESELPLDEAEAGSRGGVEDIFIAKDHQMTALKMLHRIQEPFREVFMLRTFCDLSHRQIGELFGKTEGWARVVYHRARLMLRQAAEEEL